MPTALVELVFHALEGGYPVEITNGVAEVARQHDLMVGISDLHRDHTAGDAWLEGVLRRRPSGVIAVFSGLTETQHELLARREIPLVLLDPADTPARNIPSVGAGNWNGGLTATHHLLDLGHRRIAIITPARLSRSAAPPKQLSPSVVLCSRGP
ncbi:hypothetical protein [Nonomuraea jabiensis]|uniref:hypothetical protein n=1 Tax=Nonomuraea jabiensis TaxID=882448 RepID=UPI003D73DAD7